MKIQLGITIELPKAVIEDEITILIQIISRFIIDYTWADTVSIIRVDK